MRDLRRIHAIAALVTSFAAGLAAAGWSRPAFVLIVISMLMLVWSLERLRHEIARREIKQ